MESKFSSGDAKMSSQFKRNAFAPENKQKEAKNNFMSKKVYIHRNSVLTDLMEINHIRSAYNITVAAFILLLTYAAIYYSAVPEVLRKDLELLRWISAKFALFAKMWLFFNVLACLVYIGFKIWARMRNRMSSKVADYSFLVMYIATILLMFTATPYVALRYEMPPVSGLSMAFEQVRIFMKIHSFVRESTPLVLQYKPSKDGSQSLYPSLRHYLYFLFIPAFIYRDSYPRTKKINWKFTLQNILEFIVCVLIVAWISLRFNADVFQNTRIQPFSLVDAMELSVGLTLRGSVALFLFFYFLLHCWLNIFAELLRFGDRQFYQDWWNSTSFPQYYRRWNLVVSDWLLTYVYADTYMLCRSRTFSLILVFLVSALVHEYIITVALGFCYPVTFVLYSTVGVSLMFLTKDFTAHFWNVFTWCCLFFGVGLLFTLYSLEWYARANCASITESTLDFFTPRSWDKSCSIFRFS